MYKFLLIFQILIFKQFIIFLYPYIFYSDQNKNAKINILCTIFTYKDDGDSCDSGLWQALIKVILDIYIYKFHYKPLYICIMVK